MDLVIQAEAAALSIRPVIDASFRKRLQLTQIQLGTTPLGHAAARAAAAAGGAAPPSGPKMASILGKDAVM